MFLMVALTCSTLGTFLMGYELRTEQQAISEVLKNHSDEQIATLESFPEELRWQFTLSWLLVIVLVSAFVVVLIILRGYLHSQRTLRTLSRQAEDILESMEQGVLTGDKEGNLIMMNREAQRLLGSPFPSKEMTYQDLDRRTGMKLGAFTNLLLKNKHPLEDQSFNFKINGHHVHLVVAGHLLRDENGDIHGTVLHIRDVTEQHFIQKRIQRMEGYMGLAPVAAGLQHEMKNPLSALSLHVQLLGEYLSENQDPEVVEEVEILRSEIRRIGNVLETFNDFATANVLDQKETDLRFLVGRVIKLFLPQASSNSLKIKHAMPKEPVIGFVDSDKIEQVVINLLLNALEAMGENGEIILNLNHSLKEIILEVIDQGPGIAKAAVDNLFAPYFTTKKNGLGMGLAVCRKIARQHGGELTCMNETKGATFKLVLPASNYATE